MISKFEIALEFCLWGIEVLSRRDFGLILSGYRVCEADRELDRFLERLKKEKLLEQEGRGAKARFRITETGRRRVRVSDPSDHWNQLWDGQWRAFLFDLPSPSVRERQILWRALREARMGCLQKSVWIWPFEVEPLLQEAVQAHGIPDCFCGFRISSLFLTSQAEVVAGAWDFEEIGQNHRAYLNHLVANVGSLNKAKNLQQLARVARIERDAYRNAFFRDPLLPRALWPKSYEGTDVEEATLSIPCPIGYARP